MPYIQISLSKKLEDDKIVLLKAMLGEKIALLPGKSESVLMIEINYSNMFFQGEPGNCAMIQVHLYKESPKEAKSLFTSEMLKAFNELTNIPVDRIFMNFAEHSEWASRGTLK